MTCTAFNPDLIPIDQPVEPALLQSIKQTKWCGTCLNCLYTYIMLAPTLSDTELVEIFGNDLLDNADLAPVLDELAGFSLQPNPNYPRIARVSKALQKIQKERKQKALIKHYINESIRQWEGDLFEDYFNMSMT